MVPKDPKTYLWSNIELRLKEEDRSTRGAAARLGIPHTNVARLMKGNAEIRTDTLVTIAAKLGVEVWELLVPPGNAAAKITPISKENPDLTQVLAVLERALAAVDPAGLNNLLETVELLIIDPNHRDARRQYVLSLLSGEFPATGSQKKAAQQ